MKLGDILKANQLMEKKMKCPAIYESEIGNIYFYANKSTLCYILDGNIHDWCFLDFATEQVSDKNITCEYLSNTYGEVKSTEHAEFIIELAENAGFELARQSKHHGKFFSFDVKGFCFLDTEIIASQHCKQITIPLPPKADSKKWSPDFYELGKPPKHFDCVCNKCGGKCCMGQCDKFNDKSFAGVATIGKGKYRSRAGSSKIKSYKVWEGMITRCYVTGSDFYKRYGGRGVKVCDEWLNYQNFAAWYESQPKSNISGFEIDKDLTVMGSKIYSPECCALIPRRVNSLLISTNSKRGDLPVGVHRLKDKFKASCRDEFGSKVHLGAFKNQSDAFLVYKNFKKGVVVTVANEERKKGNISEKIYNNLITIDILPFPE